MAMEQQDRWQVSGNAAELYERYIVSRLHEPLAREILADVPLGAGDRVLDVACGTGIAARLAASRVLPGGSVVGLDMNVGMLAMARACSEQEELNIEWRQDEANALPFDDASFDVVLCQQGLQFFPDKAGRAPRNAARRRARRHHRAGGKRSRGSVHQRALRRPGQIRQRIRL